MGTGMAADAAEASSASHVPGAATGAFIGMLAAAMAVSMAYGASIPH
jgi:hypothetical protein